MICVQCASHVDYLYTYYSDDNIQALKCSDCGQFADKYIECDRILIFIDLLLLRPEAVRHVVFNATQLEFAEVSSISESSSHQSSPDKSGVGNTTGFSHNNTFFSLPASTFRLLIAVNLVDIYLQWATYEKSTLPHVLNFLVFTHPATQYLSFMILCVSSTISENVLVRILARCFIGWTDGGAISTSLLIGSFFKLLPILKLIWHYDIPFVEHVIQYVSLICLADVLSIALNCGYITAIAMTFAARSANLVVQYIFWKLV